VTRPTRPSLFYSFVAVVSWPILHTVFRYRATGKEHLPPTGGFVLAAGHHSNFDPWPLALSLWPGRFLRFMAKSELFWPPLGWAIAGAGGFKVRRGQADEEAMRTALSLAREGYVVAMFPEGTRRSKGLRKTREAQAHTGAARIALEANVPLVPAGIAGTDGLRRLARLKVRYGAPIPLDDLAGNPDAPRLATDRLMTAIRELEESL